jgi:hypothetical protein
MRDGNLTGADLARWFDRSDPTVRGWIKGDHAPRGAQLDVAYIEAQLDKLERFLKNKRGLPVPRLAPAKRIEHIQALKELRWWLINTEEIMFEIMPGGDWDAVVGFVIGVIVGCAGGICLTLALMATMHWPRLSVRKNESWK